MNMTNKKMLLAGLGTMVVTALPLSSHAATMASDAIASAYYDQGAAPGTPVAIIAQDDFFVDFEDSNGNSIVDAGDHFVGIVQLFNFRAAGEFDAGMDIIDDVTPTSFSRGFDTGLYGIFDVVISSALGGQYLFSAGSGSVSFVETDAPLTTLGTSFASDTTAIFAAAGATTVAVADFSGAGTTFWDVDVTSDPVIDAFDVSLNFSSESGLLPSGFVFSNNDLGTDLFGTIGDTDNFFFLPGATSMGGTPGDTPFGAGYFAGGDGDFAFVVVPSPTAAAFGLFGLVAVGVRRRKG